MKSVHTKHIQIYEDRDTESKSQSKRYTQCDDAGKKKRETKMPNVQN